jgi:hypothetical protein
MTAAPARQGKIMHERSSAYKRALSVILARIAPGAGFVIARGRRRVSNGDQVNRVAALAMKRGKSVDFTGYWQRHID